jgi:xanthine/uracil permease
MAKGIILKYKLNDLPTPMEALLIGLQWLIIAVPIFAMFAKVAAGVHYSAPVDQVIYIQKVLMASALTLGVQVLFGHRLPLLIGPAAVLLIAILASGREPAAIYTAEALGGLALFLVSVTGLFKVIKKLFTPSVVAVILILIAVTLSPTIINLLFTGAGMSAPGLLIFTLILLCFLFLANRYFVGLWKANIIFIAMFFGSVAYFLLFGYTVHFEGSWVPNPLSIFSSINFKLQLDIGTTLAFFLCFLALSVNDLGSIQSTAVLIEAEECEQRIVAGATITGLGNILTGFLGVIGVVNYSLSPGIITSTGSASRYPLIPAALGMLLISLLPGAISFVAAIPSVVIGCILIYIMSSQIAAGLLIAIADKKEFNYEQGLILGVPIMLALIITFLPPAVVATFPLLLRPLLGNSLVVGVITVLVMEHLLYRKPRQEETRID